MASDDERASFVLNLEEIVEYVLKCLCMKDLQRAAGVCRTWNSVVKKIKKNRNQLAWCFYCDMVTGGVDEQIGDVIEVLSSEPNVALLFASSTLHDDTISIPSKSSAASSRHPRAAKQEKIKLTNYLERILPPSCQLIGVVTDGIVGTDFHCKRIMEMESSISASCLFLPKIDGVDVYSFPLGRRKLVEVKFVNDETEEIFEGVMDAKEDDMTMLPAAEAETTKQSLDIETRIPNDKRVKLILLFLTNPHDKEIGKKLWRCYPDVVIAGGYTDDLIFQESKQDKNYREPCGLGIAFCGEDIQVASVIIQSNVNQEKDVETHLRRLKVAHVSEKRSIAFMFACIGRGQNFFGHKENVESGVFRKLFPTTPLIGFFGNGEIGFEHLPDYSKPARALECKSEESGDRGAPPQLYHSYTTIFVLLSLP